MPETYLIQDFEHPKRKPTIVLTLESGRTRYIQPSFLIKNFNSEEDFKIYTTAKTFEDLRQRFDWLLIENKDYPNPMKKVPGFAIKGKLFFMEEPIRKEVPIKIWGVSNASN